MKKSNLFYSIFSEREDDEADWYFHGLGWWPISSVKTCAANAQKYCSVRASHRGHELDCKRKTITVVCEMKGGKSTVVTYCWYTKNSNVFSDEEKRNEEERGVVSWKYNSERYKRGKK